MTMRACSSSSSSYREMGWPLTLTVLFVTISLQVELSRGQGNCSATQACPIAGDCCSHFNFCANDPSHCGNGCQSGPCTASGPAGPTGSCGPNNTCQNGLCCSVSGFCGSGAGYCGSGCKGGPCCNRPDCKKSSVSKGMVAGIVVGSVLVLLILIGVILFIGWRKNQYKKRGNAVAQDLEAKSFEKSQNHDRRLVLTKTISAAPKKSFSYETLQLATREFTQELGRGAFGIVYKGILRDGKEIAVKKLIDAQRDLQDFEAEVRTLGSINHTNLVALFGFAAERKQLFLVYEFMPRGSLDQWIFEKCKTKADFVLPWETRVTVLKGTAKGLAYLHKELQGGQTIIHLDIKPQNILLDESFVPKIADFGLSKLLGEETTHQTLAAGGTMGYMAPEVYVGAASTKMDVYSFGMMMLEVVSGRGHVDHKAHPDSLFLPSWAVRKLYQGEQLDVVDCLFEEEEFDLNVATTLIWVALLCLQRDPDQRPDMHAVLRMMDGIQTPSDLPATLQSELEMAEKLIRGRGPKKSKDSVNFIEFSTSGENPPQYKKGGRQSRSQRPVIHAPDVKIPSSKPSLTRQVSTSTSF